MKVMTERAEGVRDSCFIACEKDREKAEKERERETAEGRERII
jgi:hypothetical protein